MFELVLYIAGGAVIVLALVLLLRRPRVQLGGGLSAPAEFFPIHSRYFPQVCHALCWEDAPYLSGRGSRPVYRRWRKSIRRAGRMYLSGLREDFSRLNRLARHLALHSPQVRARQQAELFRLNVHFQFLYSLVLWKFLIRQPGGQRLEQMAALIGSLGSRLEQATLTPEATTGAFTP